MKKLISVFLLWSTSLCLYSQSDVKDYRQFPRYHTYLQTNLSYTQFMYKVRHDNFYNRWKSQLGGGLSFGWRKNSAFGPRLTFAGQIGAILHRTKVINFGSDDFSKIGGFLSLGLETDETKWKIGIMPWLAYFPDMQFQGRYDSWHNELYDQWWLGFSLNLARPISPRLDLSSGFFYGRHISDVPFRYGTTRDMPFWINLGIRFHAWGRY